jgi:hypothetical protein
MAITCGLSIENALQRLVAAYRAAQKAGAPWVPPSWWEPRIQALHELLSNPITAEQADALSSAISNLYNLDTVIKWLQDRSGSWEEHWAAEQRRRTETERQQKLEQLLEGARQAQSRAAIFEEELRKYVECAEKLEAVVRRKTEAGEVASPVELSKLEHELQKLREEIEQLPKRLRAPFVHMLQKRIRGEQEEEDEEEAHSRVLSSPDIWRLGLPAYAAVHFTAYYPKEVLPNVWSTLLAYIHVAEALEIVQRDSKKRLSQPERHGEGRGQTTVTISRGAEIVVVPELSGCRFNPPRSSLLWLEDWHRVEFRLQADPDLPGFEVGTAVNGRIGFYVGPILVGEVKIWTHFSDTGDKSTTSEPDTASAEAY